MMHDPHFWQGIRAIMGCGFAILLIRTIGVEAFRVTTGSMAPSLLGRHVVGTCESCRMPSNSSDVPTPRSLPRSVRCPNCDGRILLDRTRPQPGDRLLVDKLVFELRSPRRWEPVVFICPVDPTTPYVKRVAGLPGESLVSDASTCS